MENSWDFPECLMHGIRKMYASYGVMYFAIHGWWTLEALRNMVIPTESTELATSTDFVQKFDLNKVKLLNFWLNWDNTKKVYVIRHHALSVVCRLNMGTSYLV